MECWHPELLDRVDRAIREGRADSTHLAAALFLMHPKATVYWDWKQKDNGVAISDGKKVFLSVQTTERGIEVDEFTFAHFIVTQLGPLPIHYHAIHTCGVGLERWVWTCDKNSQYLEFPEARLPDAIYVSAPESQRILGIKQLCDAMESNRRAVALIANHLPVAEIPELVEAYAYTSGTDVIRAFSKQVDTVPRIFKYMKKRPRE